MRVTGNLTYNQLTDRLVDVQSEYYKKQQQISSGNEYIDRSDDPIAAAEAAKIIRDSEDTKQFMDNVDEAKGWALTTQDTIQNVIEMLQRAAELTTSANNGTHPDSYRVNIGEEVNAIIDQVFQLTESRYGDAYLFSGTNSDQPPFTATVTNGRITAVSENGDTDTELRKTQINQSTTVTYGALGGGTDGVFASSAQSVDMLGNLIAIRDELLQGNVPASADLDQLEENLDHVIGHVTTNGVKQQWLESQTSRLLKDREVQVKQLETVQSVDLAAAMTELAHLQTTYQATMQMISNTNSMSILNYI